MGCTQGGEELSGTQEEEIRLKAGTIKHCALMVLKEAGPEGMTIDGVMAAVEAAGLRTWEQTSKRIVQFVSNSVSIV